MHPRGFTACSDTNLQVTLLTFMIITRNPWQRTFCTNNALDLALSFNDDIFNLALNDLQHKVFSMRGRKLSEYGLPQPQTVDNDRLARIRISYRKRL